MNVAELLGELLCEGVRLELCGSNLAVECADGPLPPALRAKILVAKPEILAELRKDAARERADYERRELACYRDYVAAMARAYGYDEESIATAMACLALRRGAFSVTAERIEIELAGEVRAIIRHPLARRVSRAEKA